MKPLGGGFTASLMKKKAAAVAKATSGEKGAAAVTTSRTSGKGALATGGKGTGKQATAGGEKEGSGAAASSLGDSGEQSGGSAEELSAAGAARGAAAARDSGELKHLLHAQSLHPHRIVLTSACACCLLWLLQAMMLRLLRRCSKPCRPKCLRRDAARKCPCTESS